jgi:membrane protein implicated in regulation of membrane protease activity
MPRRLRVVAFIAFCAFVALLINWPWATLTVGFALYAVGILVTLFRHVQEDDEEPGAEQDTPPPSGEVN